MIVLMREAWPGQSTRVNWTDWYLLVLELDRWVGNGTLNEEKPRSSVIPLSLL